MTRACAYLWTGLRIAFLAGLVGGLWPTPCSAEPSSARSSSRSVFRCDSRFASFRELARSDGSINAYHGLTWLGATAGVSFGARASRRWTAENGFDEAIRSGLRADSMDARRDADSASDFLVGLSLGAIPLAAIGSEFFRSHDCVETWDMFGDAFESASLALFLSEVIKVSAGRERPFGQRCGGSPPGDANCNADDRNLSFVSGHATLAAAGAGISCRFALARDAFGSSSSARIAPCAIGIAAALTVGALRVVADRHWGSDVLVGFGVGALVGYFDTWGPLEWLRVERRNPNGSIQLSGRVLPFAREGHLGAQWTMTY